MKVEELTSQQRIEILEDVLKKLESGDTGGGLCVKTENSAYILFNIKDKANKIIPILTFDNARKVTELKDRVHKEFYWWNYFGNYDLQNRIKFVKWMIEQERINILNL